MRRETLTIGSFVSALAAHAVSAEALLVTSLPADGTITGGRETSKAKPFAGAGEAERDPARPSPTIVAITGGPALDDWPLGRGGAALR